MCLRLLNALSSLLKLINFILIPLDCLLEFSVLEIADTNNLSMFSILLYCISIVTFYLEVELLLLLKPMRAAAVLGCTSSSNLLHLLLYITLYSVNEWDCTHK